MKTYNQLKVRSLGRKLGVLGLTLMLAASCGSDKKNTTSSSTSSTSTSTLNSNDGAFGQQWQNFKSSLNCRTNGSRASDRYYYSVENSASLTEGSMSGTSVGTSFGAHAGGHAVAIQKVQVDNTVYRNVVISMCSDSESYYGNTYTYFDDSDQLTNVIMSTYRITSESQGLDCGHDFLSGSFKFYSTSAQSNTPVFYLSPVINGSMSCY